MTLLRDHIFVSWYICRDEAYGLKFLYGYSSTCLDHSQVEYRCSLTKNQPIAKVVTQIGARESIHRRSSVLLHRFVCV